ncbi:MAG: Gfo/Idh/MocA family oxidoreductase [Candidatus Eisenbacteria bacterium]
MRFGLVGVGRHGIRYARHLLGGDVPGARLAAICRRDETRGRALAEEWDVAFHRDVFSLAHDGGVDALLVVSLSEHHAESVDAAAEARKPVLVEKPLAPDLAGCDRIADSAEKAGIAVMVAQTSRYEGVIEGLFRAVPSIEPVREVFFSLRSEDRTHEEGVFRESLSDGGALLDSGVHYFDLLPRLIGPVEEVWCETHFLRGSPIDDGYTALFRFGGGGRAVVDMGRWGGSRHEAIQVVGEGGILLASRTPAALERVVGRERGAVPFPEVPGTLIPALRDFVRVCRGEAKPPIGIADGRAAVALVDACRRSRGRWVRAD